MNPTKPNTLLQTMFNPRSQPGVRAAMVLLLTAGAILAMAWPASAVSVTWSDATSDDLWSTITGGAGTGNWTGGAPAGNDVIFNNTDSNATAGTVTNIVDANQTINTLRYNEVTTSTGNTHTTQINTGVTLGVTGSVAGDSSTQGNYSFYVGSGLNDAGGTGVTTATFTGGGTLSINNTGGDIIVRNTSSTNANHNAILDMTGLNQFTANVDQILVGNSNNNGTGNAPRIDPPARYTLPRTT